MVEVDYEGEYSIRTVNLWKIYSNGIQAVRGINLTVGVREIFGLLGPNGAGKTTTLRMIMGLLLPTRGKIYVWGRDVTKNPIIVRKYIGYVPQFFSLYSDLTVFENLKFYAKLYGLRSGEILERIKYVIDVVGIRRYKDVLAGNLSGGFKRRLELAAALIHDPPILILDEPTAGVDPPVRRGFWRLFRDLRNEGKIILVTTHYMDEAENCDRLALISYGEIIAEGKPREIKRMTYGGDVIRLRVKNACMKALEGLPIRMLDIIEGDNYVEIRAIVDDYATRVPEIVESLRNKNIEVLLIEQVPVTLEDAFIKLVEEGDGA